VTEPLRDQWAEWLLERRHGGDPARQRAMLEELAKVRDSVLEHARIAPGETVIDVGAGDGLIAFGALDQLGERGSVIFSDISQDLLDHCRMLAEQTGTLDRCRFLRAPAQDLSALPDASVDVVTTRSVLIYVTGKPLAFREFLRVLRPGGRISLFEPINRFAYPEPPHLLMGRDVSAVEEIAGKVRAALGGAAGCEAYPMLDFDERDLLHFAEEAGFRDLHLDLRISVTGLPPVSWEGYVRSSPNPLAPTLEQAMQHALTPEERERFVAHLRPQVEGGQGTSRMAVAYLWARKPG
jgi:ubiquinone/menaquinone biosynthesis C-methylase UbiE